MKIFVPAEQREGERRVAITPDSIVKLGKIGLDLAIEQGAGAKAGYTDDAYSSAGAQIVSTADVASNLGSADVVVSVRPLSNEHIAQVKNAGTTISFLSPVFDAQTIAVLAEKNITALSFDVLPRISRAQSMDALTSQALCAGYRTVMMASERLPKFFPMLMTAAGTIPPARVLVLGAGVAGLQAMATARRLGAVVSAYDVRASSADEVKSMGATFLNLGLDALEGAGGYAREMGEDRAKAQQDALKPFITDSDVVITTAAVPGRKAPLLVTHDMATAMKDGALIIDMAAETGGNVEGSVPGQDTTIAGQDGTVTIIGCRDVASQLATHASRLYSQNVVSLLTLMTNDGVIAPDDADEVVAGSSIVYKGEIRNAMSREALSLPALVSQEA